jgi:hypothetical protein
MIWSRVGSGFAGELGEALAMMRHGPGDPDDHERAVVGHLEQPLVLELGLGELVGEFVEAIRRDKHTIVAERSALGLEVENRFSGRPGP